MIEPCAMSFELPPLVRSTAIFIVFLSFRMAGRLTLCYVFLPFFRGWKFWAAQDHSSSAGIEILRYQ